MNMQQAAGVFASYAMMSSDNSGINELYSLLIGGLHLYYKVIYVRNYSLAPLGYPVGRSKSAD